MTDLNDNPGLLINKLGNTKVRQYDKTLIFFKDLNPLLSELQRLHRQTDDLHTSISKNPEYLKATVNLLRVLNNTKSTVETKIYEILPVTNLYSTRTKRGLVNGLGSIFKVITGNLDASDGERYEQLIRQLSLNQVKLRNQISQTHTLSHALIEKFNASLTQIYHHETALRSRLLVIQQYINEAANERMLITIRDVILQLIHIYQLIDLKLEDVENSIAFSKLETLHPSIVTQKDLLNEISKLAITSDNLPLALNLENIHLIEKILRVTSYIYDGRITFIISIPVTFATEFILYRIIPIPKLSTVNPSKFSIILPRFKTILYSKIYFAYDPKNCLKIKDVYYCRDAAIRQQPEAETTCEMSILTKKPDQTCQMVPVHIQDSLLYEIDDTNKWIATFPIRTRIRAMCGSRQQQLVLQGTYSFDIPLDCEVRTPRATLVPKSKTMHRTAFLDFTIRQPSTHHRTINLTMEEIHNTFQNLPMLRSHLESIEELTLARPTALSTIAGYTALIFCTVYLCYRTAAWTRIRLRARKPTPIELPNIRFPECTVTS